MIEEKQKSANFIDEKIPTKSIKSFFWLFGLLSLFTFNIWLINQGSGFTIPRELLFRTEAEILRPVIAFLIILITLLLANKFIIPHFRKLSQSKKTIFIFSFCLVSAFSLLNTVQTNPDYGRYQVEAKYLVDNGMINFFKDWGEFYCDIDMPILPFIYGLAFKIVGEGQAAVLLINFLIFLSLLWLTYLIAKRFFKKKVAFLSITFLSTTPFVITQAPLFLVDLGQTFFLALSFYSLLNLVQKPSFKKSITVGFILFITSLTKTFSIIFLIPFLVASYAWAKWKKKERYTLQLLTVSWGMMVILDLTYVFWKKEIFYEFISEYVTRKLITSSIMPLAAVGILLTILMAFGKKYFDKSRPLAILLIYFVLGWLFFLGGKYAFYLRSIFVATNIPLAIFFYASIYFSFKKKSMAALLLLLWSFTPIFIPNTMFKYQLPSYPAIMILAAFSLVSIFKDYQKQIKYLLIILAFSISITYFFFLPMIQNHAKVNIREATEFANQFHPQKIIVLFLPIGKYGQMLQASLERTEKCPRPPSLTDLIDYYTRAGVIYKSQEEFLSDLEKNQIPDVVFLVNHYDKPLKIPTSLKEQLDNYFLEGPIFDQANGAGIWRVKLKLYRGAGPQ